MRIGSHIELGALSRNSRSVSRAAFLTAFVSGALLALASRQAQASVFTVNMVQVGPDVVATGSGSFDLTGLTLQATGGSSAVEMGPSTGELGVGDPYGFYADAYANNASFGPGLIGPSSFGSGGYVDPSGGTSPDFLFSGPGGDMVLPAGYVSGTPLADSSTYASATFASLGITPGTYTWTWDGGANSLVLNAVPEPASLSLLGAGMVGALAVRRRRRAS